MCGLGGVARVDGRDLDEGADAVLATMARTLAHRGPDAEEILRDGPVGLAFTRLSLVDPEGGGQPLVSPDGSVVLIANGEVYNHRALAAGLPAGGRELRGGSDCEVLVHLYQQKGLAFLDDVRGMFGLVLWDRRRNVLLMARDHFGVKPLFYSRDRERVVFASEIKALFSDPRCPRRVAWDEALASPSLTASPALDVSAPTTWFEGVASVPAATIVEIDLAGGTTREHVYWTPPDFMGDPAADGRDDQDIVAEFRALLTESVRDCATADVSIGLFLSGGVDSAAVAALAAGTTSLETFTVLSASTVVNGDARYARLVADSLGVPNHQILFEASHVPSAAEWKRLLWLTEMPTCGPEQYYKHELHRHVRSHHPEIKGMLLGAAADEFCGGYSVQTSGGRGWNGFMAALTDMDRAGRLQDGPRPLGAWWEGVEAGLLSDAALAHVREGHRDPYALFVAAKMRDVEQFNCWHEDRTAAGSGIEARVPFLDRRLFELVATIPPDRRERLLWDKAIVREAVAGLLPREVVDRPKVPFFYGEGVQHTHRTFITMLAQDDHALLEEALAGPRGKEYLNAGRVHDLVRRLERAPLSGHVERLLPLINLCLLDRMAEDLPPAPAATATLLPDVRAAHSVDWSDGGDEALALTVAPRRWDDDSRLVLADGVALLRATDGTTRYLAVDGSLEYVLEGDEPWSAFLTHLDGSTTVRRACAEAGTTTEELSPLLTECLDLGLLVPAPSVPATGPAPRPAPSTEPGPTP
ncbi:asparagine synthase (glutamine-hydrolyzing) [Streptomyces lavendulocolor]|uniref:asparagine synthase (glutamine-hydrolyzing) n=1 Tax=Streptomyces lavendulocolor TaxID=67316 RepID=UPI003C30B69E